MGLRRKAREIALQVLFSWDAQAEAGLTPQEAFRLHQENFHSPKAARDYARTLVTGVMENLKKIDSTISRGSRNWKVGRMGIVDRNILRIAVYEINHMPDVPATVAINEAVDMAKKFGTADSGAFINGILDAVKDIMEAGHNPRNAVRSNPPRGRPAPLQANGE